MSRVVVVGLGPGDPGLITVAVRDAIARIPHRFLRTRRHPSADLVGEAEAFDDVYERSATFEEVYAAIVARVVAAAHAHGEVLYAVPGSPLVAEHTVELLRAQDGVEVEIHPGMGFIELVWAAVGVDPLAGGVRLVDGHRFGVDAAGERGPLLVAQVDHRDVLSDIKLAVEDPPAAPVVVLQRLGLPDERVVEVAWEDLDRVVEPDHLTALWIPELAAPVAAELVRFTELVRTLRAGCPWDREQTHASLGRHLLEEAHEVLEAIDELDVEGGEGYDALEEELGDLLFQIVFHATIAAEAGQFALADVARGVHDKLVARHPHVFGESTVDTAEEVMAGWERNKQVEKGRSSLMDGIPKALPALALAQKVQKKAATVGLDWDDAEGAAPKVAEELAELARAVAAGEPRDVADELGDVLFSVVNVARHLGVDAEGALRAASGKFRRRFELVEVAAAEAGTDLHDLDAAALDRLWEQAKGARPSGEPAGERPGRAPTAG